MKPLRSDGRKSMAVFPSITWSLSGPSCRNRGPTRGRSFPSAAREQERGRCAERARTASVWRRRAVPVLEVMIDYCHKQALIPAPLSVDSLFDDVTGNWAPNAGTPRSLYDYRHLRLGAPAVRSRPNLAICGLVSASTTPTLCRQRSISDAEQEENFRRQGFTRAMADWRSRSPSHDLDV